MYAYDPRQHKRMDLIVPQNGGKHGVGLKKAIQVNPSWLPPKHMEIVMYEIMNAHPLTVIITIGAFLVTPFYIFATYVFSGASPRKGAQVGTAFLLWGAFMFWGCIANVPGRLGLIGNIIVPMAWLIPSLILYLKRDWFLETVLSQRWLIGLQIFRVIGGVFLIEMVRGNLPGVFAYPAGIGDIFVAVVAWMVLMRYRPSERIPAGAIFLVIGLGVADFISAFFFGFTSSETPLQLFHHEAANQVVDFPTGLIPLFLVPYAIFFHLLSALNYIKHGNKETESFVADHLQSSVRVKE